MKNTVFAVITVDLESTAKVMAREEAIAYKNSYNERYPLNTPYMVIECELDEDGEVDLSNYNVIE